MVGRAIEASTCDGTEAGADNVEDAASDSKPGSTGSTEGNAFRSIEHIANIAACCKPFQCKREIQIPKRIPQT